MKLTKISASYLLLPCPSRRQGQQKRATTADAIFCCQIAVAGDTPEIVKAAALARYELDRTDITCAC